MTHHDGTDHDHDATEGTNETFTHDSHTETAEEKVTDYVGPVDHGDGETGTSSMDESEEGDYVNPVDHG